MARPGLLRHRKFIRLARLLQSDALALGHLGIVWDACYESGDDVIGTAADLEYLAKWNGDPGLLAAYMVESGFIDVTDDGTHRVHDLYDHAPEYVQRRMEREQQRRDKGVTISELRAAAGRKGGMSKGKQTEANDGRLLSKCQANGSKRQANGSKRQANGKQTAQLPHPAPSTEIRDSGVPESLSAGADASSLKQSSESNGTPRGLLRLIELWNQLPDVQHCREATAKRTAAYKQRAKKQAWMESVKEALERVRTSAFCRGKNDRGWVADIDWFLKPDTVTRILEGKYDDRTVSSSAQPDNMPLSFEEAARLLNGTKPQEFVIP